MSFIRCCISSICLFISSIAIAQPITYPFNPSRVYAAEPAFYPDSAVYTYPPNYSIKSTELRFSYTSDSLLSSVEMIRDQFPITAPEHEIQNFTYTSRNQLLRLTTIDLQLQQLVFETQFIENAQGHLIGHKRTQNNGQWYLHDSILYLNAFGPNEQIEWYRATHVSGFRPYKRINRLIRNADSSIIEYATNNAGYPQWFPSSEQYLGLRWEVMPSPLFPPFLERFDVNWSRSRLPVADYQHWYVFPSHGTFVNSHQDGTIIQDSVRWFSVGVPGRFDTISWQKFETGQWVNDERRIFSYDSANRIHSITLQKFQSGQWEVDSRKTWPRNQHGYLLAMMNEHYNTATLHWEIAQSAYFEYTYDSVSTHLPKTITFFVADSDGIRTEAEHREFFWLPSTRQDPPIVVEDTIYTNRVYPNPFSDVFYVEVEKTETFMQLFDAYGKLIMSQKLEPGINEISAYHLQAAGYILNVIQDGMRKQYRLIKYN
ncbi:MAG: T9SS type A sorting domain-containing protein [Bacteroidia bacterium]